jgi:sulfite reductase (NADPH) flavoprotein alpha-component
MHADAQVLREVKHALLGGIRAFEQHEADVVELAGADLLTALRGAVDAVSLYYRRLADHTRGHGITAADDPVVEPIPPDRGLPGHGGPLG